MAIVQDLKLNAASKSDISCIRNEMITRNDLSAFKEEVKNNIKVEVGVAIDPIRRNLSELQQRVERCEQNPGSSSGNVDNRQLQNMIQQLDPANRRVAFIGMTGSESERLDAITSYLRSMNREQNISIGHFFKGKRGDRSLSTVSFVEFSTEDARDNFIRNMGNANVRINGRDVKVKKALSKLNAMRNAALRRATDKIKAHPMSRDKTVKIEWAKERGVTVDGIFAFTQNQTELQGSFVTPFNDLKLE